MSFNVLARYCLEPGIGRTRIGSSLKPCGTCADWLVPDGPPRGVQAPPSIVASPARRQQGCRRYRDHRGAPAGTASRQELAIM